MEANANDPTSQLSEDSSIEEAKEQINKIPTASKIVANIRLRFPSPKYCQIAKVTLSVDKEGYKQITKELEVVDDTLIIHYIADKSSIKNLRSAINGIFENLTLIGRTFDEFPEMPK